MNDSPLGKLCNSLNKKVYHNWHCDILEEITKEEANLLLKLGVHIWETEEGKHNK